MLKKFKSILAVLAAIVITVSGFGGTAFASEVNSIQTGTYTGVYRKVSEMAGTVEYTYSMVLSDDGTYTYAVSFTMGESVYSNEEEGTYVVDGEVITFTPSEDKKFKNDADTYTGTIVEGVMSTVTKCVSNFASTPVELTFTSNEGADTEGDVIPDDDANMPENLDTLESGSYAVDLTWIPFMDNMLDPIVEIDAEKDTFKLYNAKDPATVKGSGTVRFEEGVYTLVYDDADNKMTTFTYDAETDTITFTSQLYYGANGFNNTDEAGNFVSYTAVVTTLSTPDAGEDTTTPDAGDGTTAPDAGDDATASDDNVEKAPQTGDMSHVGLMSVACMAAAAVAVILMKKRELV